MRKTFIPLLLLGAGLLNAGLAHAQDPLADDSTRGWKKSAVVGLSVTQAAYSNWKAGGENSFAGTGSFDVLLEHFSEKFYTAHLFQVAYGENYAKNNGWRKINDLLRYNFLAIYRSSSVLRPTFALDFRSQLAAGYDYELAEEEVRISTFMAPGYLTETAGLSYTPNAWFGALFGVAAKQTFVLDDALRDPDDPSFSETNGYGNSPDQKVRNEVGLNLGVLGSGEITKNVVGRSELSVFAAFDQMDHPDVRWNNSLQLKVNDWLNTTIEFELFYDHDQSEDIQLRQTLAVGVGFNLL